jgi:DNA-binding NarL/FixJ family response regulator
VSVATYAPTAPTAPRILWRGTLTPCEAAVLELASRGLSNREIGERLYVTDQTAKWHMARVFWKTGTRNRVEAARWWWLNVEAHHPTRNTEVA